MDGFCPFVRVSHVTIDRREDRVSAPWTGHETICEGEREPVGREKICSCWFPEGARGLGLNKTIDSDDENN